MKQGDWIRRAALLSFGAWAMFFASVSPALAATAPSLGSAQSFAVLGGSTVTNTGSTTINGDLGVSPGSAVTGFPPGTVTGGTIHAGDADAARAQSGVTSAYNSLTSQGCTADLTGQDLGGKTLTPGVYCFSSSAQLTGPVTLDAQGNSSAAFVFKIGSTLTTASGSSVRVINGGSACNVFWQVGSSATLGTTTAFAGNILALTSITLNTGADLFGRALARNGAVTLASNNISGCAVGAATPTATATATLPTATATAIIGATQTAVGATATAIATLPPATRTAIVGATQTAVRATTTAVIGPTQTAVGATPTTVAAKPPTSCVGNIRGHKLDGSGRGLAGWTIQLLQGNQVVQSAVTDSGGNFNFLGLGMGTYTVQEVQQPGWVNRAPTSISVTLTACNQNLTGYTFINVPATSALTPAPSATPSAPALTPTPLLTRSPAAVPTGTPPRATGPALVIPTHVASSPLPKVLPRTGGSLPPGSVVLGLILGVLLVAVGLEIRRERA